MTMRKITKIYLLSIGIVILFTLMDIGNITPFHRLNSPLAWGLYNQYSAPAIFFSWLGAFVILGILWFIATKDKSEALAVFLTPTIMVYLGLEDILFHIFKQVPMVQCMEWLNGNPVLFQITKLLGGTCINPASLIISTIIGLVVSYYVLKKLFKI